MREIKNKFDLLEQLIRTNFKMRYQNSVLGIIWVVIKPYLTFAVLYVVWTKLRGEDIIDFYSIYLLTGIVFYTYINELIIFGMNSILDLKNIILKVNFPRQIALVSSLSNAAINLLINFGFIIFVALIVGVDIQLSGLIYFIFIASIAFVWAIAIASFSSIFLVKFRDLKNIADLGLYLLYWLTPIFYVVESFQLTGTITDLIKLNPIGIMINQIRSGFNIYGEINIELMLIFLSCGLLANIFGWLFFKGRVKRVAEFI